MTRKRIRAAFVTWSISAILLVGISIFTAAANAQATVATLTGLVRRADGAPATGAFVVVAGQRDTLSTDGAGRFSVQVQASVAGTVHAFQGGDSATASFSAIPAGGTRVLTLTLASAGAMRGAMSQSDTRPEEPPVATPALRPVVITAGSENPATLRPLLDTSSATTGGTISYAEMRSLPADARDPLALAFTVPGAAQATGFFDTAPILSLDGQNSLYTQYYIDGFDNNEGVLGGPRIDLPLSAIKRLDVRASTYDATLGRSSNGVVNEETMSGTDAWRGEAFVYGHPGHSFDAHQAVLPPNTSAGFRRSQIGGSLGGPIVKGRTFLFAAGERLDETQDQPIVTHYGNATGATQRTKTKLFARIDQRWSSTQTTTLHAALSDEQYIGRGGGNVVPEADVAQHRFGALVGMSHHSALDPATTNTFDAQVAAYHWYYPPTTSSLNTPQIAILSRGLDSTLAVVGSSGFQYDSHETQLNLKDEIEHHAGAHDIRLGADMIAGRFRLHGDGSNLAGTYSVIDSGQIHVSGRLPTAADVPSNIPVYNFSIDATPQFVAASQTVVGAYAQDSWDATHSLKLTYGVRWDYDDLTSRGASSPDLSNVQPRASFNWRPDSASVVRGGFGIYSGKLPYTIYSDALQFGPNGSEFVTLYNSPATPLSLGHAPSAATLAAARGDLPPREIRTTFARGLKSPRSYQSSLGFEHAFGNSWGISLDAVYVQTTHLPRLFDLNAITREIGPADTTNLDPAAGDPLRPIAPRNGSFRQHTTTETGGRSWYAAMFFTLRHQFTESFTGDASYVLSHARDNTADINFAATNGNNDFAKEWGDAVNDRRHKVNVRGVYTWSRRLQLSGVVDYQTGQPINRVSGLDLIGSGGSYGDGFIRNTQRFYGVPRNGERLPYALEINPGLAYLLPVTGGNLELRIDAFNLLNRANFSGFPSGLASLDPRTQVGRPGDPIVYQLSGRPRQIQLSARYAF
ncbi:MAG: TonB-dependent receptor [Gemmatimonadaceae bacterium]